MPKPVKLLVGVLTALPIVLAGYLIFRFMSVFFGVLDNGGTANADQLQDTFYELLGIQLTIVGTLVVLLGIYLWHLLVVQAGRKSDTSVPAWVLALVFLPVIAMPVYWLTILWPESGPRQARAMRNASIR